jgi:hypothetical protein
VVLHSSLKQLVTKALIPGCRTFEGRVDAVMAMTLLQLKPEMNLVPQQKWLALRGQQKESMLFVYCQPPFDHVWWAFWVPVDEVKEYELREPVIEFSTPDWMQERGKSMYRIYQQYDSLLKKAKKVCKERFTLEACFVCGYHVVTWPSDEVEEDTLGYRCSSCSVAFHQVCVPVYELPEYPLFHAKVKKTSYAFNCPPSWRCSGCLMKSVLKASTHSTTCPGIKGKCLNHFSHTFFVF